MRLISNEELLVVAGGDDDIQTVTIVGKRPIDSNNGGLIGGGGGGMNFGPKGSITPELNQSRPGNEISGLTVAKCAIDTAKAIQSPNPLNIAAATVSCAPVVTYIIQNSADSQYKADQNFPYRPTQG